MRITGITTHVVGTPWRSLTYVLVHTDEGLTGVGETRMLGHTDALVGYLREAEANHIARELFESQAVDIIQPDIGHLGGIWETRKLAATAETHCTMIAPHNVGGSVLTAASLQLASCTPNFKILEHFNDFADAEIKKVVKGAPEVDPETGCFTVSHAPGLGVELDVDAAAEFPQQRARFDLWAEGWERRAPATRGRGE
ncbi:enolase C-terminal domain-like protein [Streptomyces sp. NPDC017254]|uniref:enolase C-terminal domain-like protein n=1 Tax=unclassified Streptomyces TaxID=2593676 RepID=UPI0037BC4362